MPHPCTCNVDPNEILLGKTLREANGIRAGSATDFEHDGVFVLKEGVPRARNVFWIFENMPHFFHFGKVLEFSSRHIGKKKSRMCGIVVGAKGFEPLTLCL